MTILIVAQPDAGYSRTGASWFTQASGGYLGGPFDYSPGPGDTATFAVTLPQAGTYKIAITYVEGPNRATATAVAVKDGAATVLSTAVDQTAAPADLTYSGSGFKVLSASPTFATTSASVVLFAPGTVYTIADAVYLELIDPPPPPPPPPPPAPRRGGPGRSLRRLALNFTLPRPEPPAASSGTGRGTGTIPGGSEMASTFGLAVDDFATTLASAHAPARPLDHNAGVGRFILGSSVLMGVDGVNGLISFPANLTVGTTVGSPPPSNARWILNNIGSSSGVPQATVVINQNANDSPPAGFGGQVLLRAKDSVSTSTPVAEIDWTFSNITHATYTGDLTLKVHDWAGVREGIRVASDGTQALVGFYGATPVAKAATPSTLSDVIALLQALGLCN